VHGLLQAEDLQLAHVVPEDARVRPVAARMRLPLRERAGGGQHPAVGPERGQGVAERGPDVLLGHHEVDHDGPPLGLLEEGEERGDGVGPPALRDLRE